MNLLSNNRGEYDQSVEAIQKAYSELTSLLSNAVEPNEIDFPNDIGEPVDDPENGIAKEANKLNATRIATIHDLVEKQLDNLKKYEEAREKAIENNNNKNTISGFCTPIRKKVCKLASFHTIVVAIRGLGFVLSGYGASEASSPLFFSGLAVYLSGEMADKCAGLYETHAALELDQAQFLLTVDNNLVRDYERLETCLRELYEIKKYHELATVQMTHVGICTNQVELQNHQIGTHDFNIPTPISTPSRSPTQKRKNEPALSSSGEIESIYDRTTINSQNLFEDLPVISDENYLNEIEMPPLDVMSPRLPVRRKAVVTFSNESQTQSPGTPREKTIDERIKTCLKNYCQIRTQIRGDENDANYTNLLGYIVNMLPEDHYLKDSINQLDPMNQLIESGHNTNLRKPSQNIDTTNINEKIELESYVNEPKSQKSEMRVSQAAWTTGGEQAKQRSTTLTDDTLLIEQNVKRTQFDRSFIMKYEVQPPKFVKLPSGWIIDSEGATTRK